MLLKILILYCQDEEKKSTSSKSDFWKRQFWKTLMYIKEKSLKVSKKDFCKKA